MSPETPTRSHSFSRAVSRIRSAGTMTPRSMTSKPLHCRTTPTMFLPMSCTSPFAVARTIRPARPANPPGPGAAGPGAAASPAGDSASSHGVRCATAFFITRADLTTWGRNIRPAPNRSPTTFIPAISGPSMTSSGRAAARRASSVSASMWSATPATRACSIRFSTGHERHSASDPPPPPVRSRPAWRSATARSRSPASGRRSRITSSTAARRSGATSSKAPSCPALTMAMSRPARMAW